MAQHAHYVTLRRNWPGQKLAVFAYDNTAGAKTGDAANITARISLDGGTSGATNDVNPTELDATNHPGIYIFDLTQAESQMMTGVVTASSVTSNIEIDPVIITTFDFAAVLDAIGASR